MKARPDFRVPVDADFLLAGSSLQLECLVDAVRRRPSVALRAAFWAARGREHLARELARHSDVDVTALPYRVETIEELRQEANAGARLVLIANGSEALAQRVADHLGVFAEVRDGEKGERRAAEGGIPLQAVLRALRPYQWLKNTLVFLPFLLAHEIRSVEKWIAATLMFAAFSLCASAAYVINDIFDRAQDRRHPRRSLRPIASGAVPLAMALWMPLPLAALAALCCVFLPAACGLTLAVYLGLTIVYSTSAKKLIMADAMLLAGLYLLRLVAGSLATANVVSHWLLAFALTLFLSLALSKRVSELIAWRKLECGHSPGRSYRAEDVPVLEMMAVASGFLACLIMVLYIQSPEILRLYRRPAYLWVGVAALLYWLGRLFIYSHRGECPDDPLFFALQDRTTRVVLGAAAALAFFAV
jgi:4-hydroxybenzoate polyprenyltransferase